MTRRSANLTGIVAVFVLIVFWAAVKLAPEKVDALLRPYGLFVLFGVLLTAVGMSITATVRASKWWLVAVFLGLGSILRFFVGVMS